MRKYFGEIYEGPLVEDFKDFLKGYSLAFTIDFARWPLMQTSKPSVIKLSPLKLFHSESSEKLLEIE